MNTFQFWSFGFPIQSVNASTTITMQYWSEGFPYQFVMPTAGSPPSGSVVQVLMCLGVGS